MRIFIGYSAVKQNVALCPGSNITCKTTPSRTWVGRLFRTHGPVAATLLSPNVLCAWNSARSVGGRAEPTSRTFGNQIMYVVSRQPSMEVPGRTKTSKRNMPAWSRHVSGQEASATDKELARSHSQVPIKSRAAAFWTDWNFRIRLWGRPYSSELQ